MQPWCERQREALIAFRQAIASRAEREKAIVEEEQTRARTTEQHYADEKQRVEGEYASAQTDAVAHAEQTRTRLQELHDEQRAQIEREYKQTKDKVVND